jgi:hypothetical protein
MRNLVKLLAAVLVSLCAAPLLAETLPSLGLSFEPGHPVRVDAVFDHGVQDLDYSSRWSGTLRLVVAPGGDGTMHVELRVGMGKVPRGLSALWYREGQEYSTGTGSVPLCLAAGWADEKALNRWVGMKASANPALVIPLIPVSDPGEPGMISPPRFTNPYPVHGRVFLLEPTSGKGKKPRYRRYAEMTIPPNGLLLWLATGQQGQQLYGLDLGQVALHDVSQSLWQRILEDGNTHLQLPAAALPAHSRWFLGGTDDSADGPAGLQDLADAVEGLRAAETIGAEEASRMMEHVEDSAKHLRMAELPGAAYAMIELERRVRLMAGQRGWWLTGAAWPSSTASAAWNTTREESSSRATGPTCGAAVWKSTATPSTGTSRTSWRPERTSIARPPSRCATVV